MRRVRSDSNEILQHGKAFSGRHTTPGALALAQHHHVYCNDVGESELSVSQGKHMHKNREAKTTIVEEIKKNEKISYVQSEYVWNDFMWLNDVRFRFFFLFSLQNRQ